jgi:hypothetical protein
MGDVKMCKREKGSKDKSRLPYPELNRKQKECPHSSISDRIVSNNVNN